MRRPLFRCFDPFLSKNYFMGIAEIAIAAAVVSAGTAAYSAYSSSENAGEVADAQNKATAAGQQTQLNAQQQQQKNFDLVQGQEAPYRQLGTDNIGSLQQMLSGGYDMKASPSAQYALGQGTKSINSNLQARGLEGNAVTQLGQLSGSTAAQDYQNRFSQLLSATNIGSNAVAMTGSGVNSLNSNLQSGANTSGMLGQSAAGNLGNIAMNNGNNQAGIIGSAAGNLVGLGTGALGNYVGSGSGYTPGQAQTSLNNSMDAANQVGSIGLLSTGVNL